MELSICLGNLGEVIVKHPCVGNRLKKESFSFQKLQKVYVLQ